MGRFRELSEQEYAQWRQEAGFPQLRQILFWRWDPLGVDDAFPVTADEYDSYVKVLLSRLRRGMEASEIASYLLEVERDSMGRRYTDDAVLVALGARVVEWFEESLDHWQDRRVQS